MSRHDNGYRYVRQYGADFSRDPRRDTSHPAWALYEVQQGRAKRVGRADAPYWYLAFLFRGPVEKKYLEQAS